MEACYLEDIERILGCGCTQPGCDCAKTDTLYVRSKCHPKAPIDVVLKAGTGVVLVMCRECSQPIIAVAIASRLRPENN
jgi:hypothetical protein